MLRPPLILIVEDDPLQREVLAELLRSKNIDVIECASAEAAELVIGRSGAELSALISDVMLPGQSGVELARFAKSQFSSVEDRPCFGGAKCSTRASRAVSSKA